jgi:hypothetical protein
MRDQNSDYDADRDSDREYDRALDRDDLFARDTFAHENFVHENFADEPFIDEPELAGYQPHGERPLHSRHLYTAMRVIVVIGLIGLVLPGIVITVGTANRTAESTCAIYTRYYAPEAIGFSARFELVSAAGLGWNCYAEQFGGGEVLVQSLGLIPGGPSLPIVPIEKS